MLACLLVPALLFSGCRGGVIRGSASQSGDQSNGTHKNTIEAQPEWFSCKTNPDCMPVEGPCGEVISLNKQFQQAFAQYKNAMATELGCPTATNPEKPQTTECINHRCAVVMVKSE